MSEDFHELFDSFRRDVIARASSQPRITLVELMRARRYSDFLDEFAHASGTHEATEGLSSLGIEHRLGRDKLSVSLPHIDERTFQLSCEGNDVRIQYQGVDERRDLWEADINWTETHLFEFLKRLFLDFIG